LSIDPNNPAVVLCVEGMNCERDGRFEKALGFFMRAWEQSADDYERCMAAHYVARHQECAAGALRWNLASLVLADKVNDERVNVFYPSLYLNAGKAHEDLGDREQALKFYGWAAETVEYLPVGVYKEAVRDGIQRGLQRVSGRASGA
jgi:tetratricopeptide (TPR) repeat protein